MQGFQTRMFFFFFLFMFLATNGSFLISFSSSAPHRGQPAAKSHPRWQPTRRLAVSCGLGDTGFEPGTAGQQSGALPLSHHASNQHICESKDNKVLGFALDIVPEYKNFLDIANVNFRFIASLL
jgi:hypothetical protein